MQEPLQVNFPTAHLEVKIVSPIPFRRSVLNPSFRRVRILLCNSMEGLEDDSQAEYHEISPNGFDHHHSLLSSSFRDHPSEINHPAFGSAFDAIHRTLTFPVGRALGDARRDEKTSCSIES